MQCRKEFVADSPNEDVVTSLNVHDEALKEPEEEETTADLLQEKTLYTPTHTTTIEPSVGPQIVSKLAPVLNENQDNSKPASFTEISTNDQSEPSSVDPPKHQNILPQGWTDAHHKETGGVHYYNAINKNTTGEKPTDRVESFSRRE